MKLNKSDRNFLEACQNPEKRTALVGNLVTQRKWYYVIAGLLLVLCVAEPVVYNAEGRGASPSPFLLFEFMLVTALALHADSKIKRCFR